MSTQAEAKRLLVIDDMVDICTLVASVAERCGFEVKTTVDPMAFREIYRAFRPHVIILDLAIPDSDGIDLLRFLVDEGCTAKVLIMSGFPAGVQEAAKRLGEVRGLAMADTLPKPLRAAELRAILMRLRDAA
ncbi:MAG: response regulator [Alphaproteobacteria bacterium]